MLDELEGTVDLVLAPSRDPAPQPGAVAEGVAELVPAGGQTGRVDVGLVEVDGVLCVQDGDVIAQSAGVELWVLEQPHHGVLLVVHGLRGVEATGVILSYTDLQQPEEKHISSGWMEALQHLLILLDVLELVSSGDDLPGAGTVVVAAVLSDDGTAADEVVVLVEHQASPGELSGGGLAVLEVGGRTGVGPGSTLLH